MKNYLLILVILCGLASCQFRPVTELRFHENGRFKIVQFTDLHWASGLPSSAQTTATIQHLLQTEKPDLAVLTGDVVTATPAEDGWTDIIDLFDKARIPFTVVMGNHDAEQQVSRRQIYQWLARSPYFVGEEGPEDIRGCGNFVLPIKSSRSDAPAALLYGFDSNDYPEDPLTFGHYDCIKYDQIAWYRRQSEQFTAAHHGQPLPALAFFHIPLPEYVQVLGENTTIGHGNRGKSRISTTLNSGLFSSMDEMGDVMGCFVGHIHSCDYIGIKQGIALGFGRTTGAEALCPMERGGRVIELVEDAFRFDTWIRTDTKAEMYYYYPSGLSSLDEEALSYLPALEATSETKGVNYTYYEGKYASTSQLASAPAVKKGTLPNFSIRQAAEKDYFGYAFHTWINIPERGVYRFYTYSDDGSKLWIDGETVVDNDGSHSARYASGKVALEAGFHDLKLLYFESYMGEELEVGIASRHIPESLIPDSLLFLPR